MRTFRAATLNIWSRFGPWDERLFSIREGLKTLAPDVIGMQEVLQFPNFDQGAMVSDGLGYHVAWGEASENHGFPVGNAILSKWPIARSENIRLPDGGSPSRTAIAAAASPAAATRRAASSSPSSTRRSARSRSSVRISTGSSITDT